MPEVAHAGEDHGEALVVSGFDHLVVAYGATGLDHRRGANVGCRLVTTFSSKSSIMALSRDCTRKSPPTERTSSPARRGSGKPPVVSSRRFFLAAKIALASSVASGAITISVKMAVISLAVAA